MIRGVIASNAVSNTTDYVGKPAVILISNVDSEHSSSHVASRDNSSVGGRRETLIPEVESSDKSDRWLDGGKTRDY